MIISIKFQTMKKLKSQGLSVVSVAAIFLLGPPPASLVSLSLLNLNIISWEKAEPAVTFPYPPTLIHHFDIGDDVVGIERNFILCHCLIIIQGNSGYTSTTFLCIIHFLHIVIYIIFIYGFSCTLSNLNVIFHVIIDVIFFWRHIIPCIRCLVAAFFFLPPCLFL